VSDELDEALGTLGADLQSLVSTMQQLCLSLEASRKGKRQAEAEALRLATVLQQVRAELSDDRRWITDLANRKIAVEFSPEVRQALDTVLTATPHANHAAAYTQALERIAEKAHALVEAGTPSDPATLDELRAAVSAWRALADWA
jgi:hypothetical protein